MEEDEKEMQRYFQTAVLLTMHKQYEVLLQIAHAAGVSKEDLKAMVEAHRKGDFEVPFEW